MVVADDNQVVMETVTVESCEVGMLGKDVYTPTHSIIKNL